MKRMVITGGAGFIGINSANYFLKKGYHVTILDNFSRRGARANVKWLTDERGSTNLDIVKAEITRFSPQFVALFSKADVILHLAAQVAVTTSVTNPRDDFEINALGTFNVLEAARASRKKPIVLFSSTNKVYGGLEKESVKEEATRYSFTKLKRGVSEEMSLDFHSPYGCSKGAADQYVRDYSRIYGLRTIVFRQSCIYGPRQFGVEDQGWVAWFLIALTLGRKITIYGNGKQVRDLLYVEDLVKAYDAAIEKINITQGEIYNIGGGPKNTLSVWKEFKPILENLLGKKINAKRAAMRPGDQPIFIADISKARRDFGFHTEIGVDKGIEKLYTWVAQNKNLFK